jgi:hypothetical protein
MGKPQSTLHISNSFAQVGAQIKDTSINTYSCVARKIDIVANQFHQIVERNAIREGVRRRTEVGRQRLVLLTPDQVDCQLYENDDGEMR